MSRKTKDRSGRSEIAVSVVTGLLTGFIVGLISGFAHRNGWGDIPWGVILGISAVLIGGFFARSFGGWWSAAPFYLAVASIFAALHLFTPGKDQILLIDAPGTTLLLGSLIAALIVALLPSSLFKPTSNDTCDEILADDETEQVNDH